MTATSRTRAAVQVEGTSDSLDTITALLDRSGRTEVPLRRSLLQIGWGEDTRPGPLSGLVKARDRRGLLAYLLVVAVASAEPWMAVFPAGVWVRALHLKETAEEHSAKSAVSKVWARLVRHGLLGRARSNRRAQLQLLDESGNGDAYVRPNGIKEKDRFFSLPHAFWLDDYYRKLDLPAVAVLLILRDRIPGSELPAEKASKWYGISADTIERGLTQLRELGLLTVTTKVIKAPLSDTGSTVVHYYTLTGPFALKVAKKPAAPTRKTAPASTPAGRKGVGGKPVASKPAARKVIRKTSADTDTAATHRKKATPGRPARATRTTTRRTR